MDDYFLNDVWLKNDSEEETFGGKLEDSEAGDGPHKRTRKIPRVFDQQGAILFYFIFGWIVGAVDGILT